LAVTKIFFVTSDLIGRGSPVGSYGAGSTSLSPRNTDYRSTGTLYPGGKEKKGGGRKKKIIVELKSY